LTFDSRGHIPLSVAQARGNIASSTLLQVHVHNMTRPTGGAIPMPPPPPHCSVSRPTPLQQQTAAPQSTATTVDGRPPAGKEVNVPNSFDATAAIFPPAPPPLLPVVNLH
jgi:hypothetical protein